MDDAAAVFDAAGEAADRRIDGFAAAFEEDLAGEAFEHHLRPDGVLDEAVVKLPAEELLLLLLDLDEIAEHPFLPFEVGAGGVELGDVGGDAADGEDPPGVIEDWKLHRHKLMLAIVEVDRLLEGLRMAGVDHARIGRGELRRHFRGEPGGGGGAEAVVLHVGEESAVLVVDEEKPAVEILDVDDGRRVVEELAKVGVAFAEPGFGVACRLGL